MHRSRYLIWWMRITSSRNKSKNCRQQQILQERLNDTTMHISRFLMILINAYTARVAGTRKEYWCKGKKRVWEHIVAHHAEQMRTMTKWPTINTRRKPLPAL